MAGPEAGFNPGAQVAQLAGAGLLGNNGGQIGDPSARPLGVIPEFKAFTGFDFMQCGTGRFFNAQVMPGALQVAILPKSQAGLLSKLLDDCMRIFNQNPFLLDHAGDLSQQDIAAFAAQAEYDGVDNKQLIGMLSANTTNIMNAALDSGADLGRG